MTDFQDKANFIWQVADLLRGSYKQHEYGDVILPFTVLRRLDCVLDTKKEKVLETYNKFKKTLPDLHKVLLKASGLKFYNTSKYDLDRLSQDNKNLELNFNNYMNGFSDNVREILDNFQIEKTVEKLVKNKLLFIITDKFTEIDLHPDKVSNLEMGYIFEELIRKFNEQANETAGEHFTPREVIRLMVNLLFAENQDQLKKKGIIRTVYDPACGTGGMLTIGKEHILKNVNSKAEIVTYGQELNPQAYAIAKSDALIMGENADNIQLGNSFTEDKFIGRKFDYMLSNPPFGVSWKKEKEFIENEAANPNGRFSAGTPRVNDGAFLFLQHMISKMEPKGSRIAIVFNGSSLFTGDAGSGESDIRKWIIENDRLEAIVAMPDQLFFNTGISTYIWIVTNNKSQRRKNKVQLINAVTFFEKMRKSLGNKRNYITDKQIEEITALYSDFQEGEFCKVFTNYYFGYTKVVVERPLRQSLTLRQEYIDSLAPGYPGSLVDAFARGIHFALSDDWDIKSTYSILKTLLDREFLSEDDFVSAFKDAGIRLKLAEFYSTQQENRIRKIYHKFLDGFGVPHEGASISRDNEGQIQPDPRLRDTESIPLNEDIGEYFRREVLPHVPNAWMDRSKDKVGYEISFAKYFHKYQPLRPLKDIAADILALEKETEGLLKEITN